MIDNSHIKLLAQISVGGTPIPVPTSIQPIMQKSGPFGENIIQFAVSLLLITAVILALIFIIWSGIRWTMSEGDKQKVQNARQTLTYSIIGLVIALSAFLIVNLIFRLFGIDNIFGITTFSTFQPGQPQ